LPLDALRIGHLDGDLLDPRLAWAQFRGITATGAVLVRPDRVVCWRSTGAAAHSEGTLAEALGQVLGRRVRARGAYATGRHARRTTHRTLHERV
jgi:2,4-dichlorophenol 6-monooxygenase